MESFLYCFAGFVLFAVAVVCLMLGLNREALYAGVIAALFIACAFFAAKTKYNR